MLFYFLSSVLQFDLLFSFLMFVRNRMGYVSIFVELCAVGVFLAVSRNEVEKRGRGGRVVNFLS